MKQLSAAVIDETFAFVRDPQYNAMCLKIAPAKYPEDVFAVSLRAQKSEGDGDAELGNDTK